MATNLRLRPDAEQALRAAAARTGRSQQDLVRAAVDRYLGLDTARPVATETDALLATAAVLPARAAYRELDQLLELPAGTDSLSLLDRDERP